MFGINISGKKVMHFGKFDSIKIWLFIDFLKEKNSRSNKIQIVINFWINEFFQELFFADSALISKTYFSDLKVYSTVYFASRFFLLGGTVSPYT